MLQAMTERGRAPVGGGVSDAFCLEQEMCSAGREVFLQGLRFCSAAQSTRFSSHWGCPYYGSRRAVAEARVIKIRGYLAGRIAFAPFYEAELAMSRRFCTWHFARSFHKELWTVPFISSTQKHALTSAATRNSVGTWNLLMIERYSEFGLLDSHMPSTLRHSSYSSLRHKMARQMCCWCLTHRWWTRRPVRSWESALRTAHDCDTA